MNKIQALVLSTISALACTASLSAAAAPAVGGAVTVTGNKVGNVVAIGAKVDVKAVAVDATAGANVNSVVVKGGEVKGAITVTDNEAGHVVAIGGLVNANSVYVSTK